MDHDPLRSEDRPPTAPRRRRARDGRALGALLLAMLVAACSSVPPGAPATHPTGTAPIPSAAIAITPTPSVSADPSPADPTPSASPSAAPSVSASPSPAPSPSPSPAPRPYRLDLWHAYALVTQPNLLYCVPGASAIIVDLVRGRRAVDASALADMYAYGQSLAVYRDEGPGVDPAGWVGILDRWGAPGYGWHSYATLGDALHHAAARMRATGKPAGLVVGIHGQHAWVLTGFASTADPAAGPFTVTGVAVAGSLWPVQQYYLGYFDMPPGTWLSPAKLAPAVRPFHASVPTQWDGRFVTVEP